MISEDFQFTVQMTTAKMSDLDLLEHVVGYANMGKERSESSNYAYGYQYQELVNRLKLVQAVKQEVKALLWAASDHVNKL